MKKKGRRSRKGQDEERKKENVISHAIKIFSYKKPFFLFRIFRFDRHSLLNFGIFVFPFLVLTLFLFVFPFVIFVLS